MDKDLKTILNKISSDYESLISDNSIYILDLSLSKIAEAMGYPKVSKAYGTSEVVIPLKHPLPGMKVMIDGRTFINYAQIGPGVIVPEYVARKAGLPYHPYHAKDSMIRVFS